MEVRCVVRGVTAAAVALVATCARALADDPFANTVLWYDPGSGADPAYTDPTRALGAPARMSGFSVDFPVLVSPFAGAWEPTDLVSVGRAGSLIVRFDHPVTDDAANPYGMDLLVFGNSFYEDVSGDYTGVAGSLFSGGGRIEVSADGDDWRLISGVQADGAFPTLGFSDLSDPYSGTPGAVPTDFTRPVDPSFDPTGRTFSQIVAGYGGSGGGAGVDIGAVGLAEIQFVRITNPFDAPMVCQIDAMADVSPVPAPWTLVLGGAALRRRRR